jgi:hypothetical protein
MYAGFVWEPLTVVMQGHNKDLVPLYALISLKKKLPHKHVIYITTIVLVAITPFYGISSPELLLLFTGIGGITDGVFVLAQGTLFRCFLPIKAADHIGFTWISGVVWQITYAVSRLGALAFLEQGYPLLLWGIIGSLCMLGVVVPVTIACQVQEPMDDFDQKHSSASNTQASTIHPGKIFLFVLLGVGAASVLSDLNRVAPLLEFSPTLAGVLKFGSMVGFLVGGMLAALLPSKWATTAIKVANCSVIGAAVVYYLTDNSFVLFLCFTLTGATIVLLNQIVRQRLFANLHHKTMATALPQLASALLSIAGGSGLVAIGNSYGFDVAYMCVIPLGILALVSFRWLKPLLKDNTK